MASRDVALAKVRPLLPLLFLSVALLLLAQLKQERERPLRPSPMAERRRLALPPTVARAFEVVASGERARLASGVGEGAKPPESWKAGAAFQAVGISLPLAPPILKHDPALGDGEGDKNIVGLQLLGKGRRCVVYGMGIAWESHFEQQMAREGCETHAFDCTVDPASPVVAGKAFAFHNWCIGDGGSEFNRGDEGGSAGGQLQSRTSRCDLSTGHARCPLAFLSILRRS